ncbi:hypothetical protein [Nocardiopsis coralliicola]
MSGDASTAPGEGPGGAPGAPPEGAGSGAEPILAHTRERLAALDGVPVEEHPQVFDEIHRALAAALGEVSS